MLIPALTLAFSQLIANTVGENGNLLFVALFLITIIVAAIYYPVLIIIWLITSFRQKRPTSQEHK
ncbi:hypothetical protein L0Y40_00175 [Candidatus Wolfebacteria bacterium]|nr:hypothetical protein [Candidatus Wolfebacteria bacterium]